LDGLVRLAEKVANHPSLSVSAGVRQALDYLHFNKVVHGDLKPENVLMSARGQVTLSDFGCSKVLGSGNEYLEKCQGTPAFLAPEMMRPHSRYRCGFNHGP
jgi:[calcium/calmodulin-dependent protein kinase] kinase